MVEVFKTNVISPHHAGLLVRRIQDTFPACRANFDLQDCDHILRVVCADGLVQAAAIGRLMQACGFWAKPLPDEEPLSTVICQLPTNAYSAKASSG